MAASPDAYTQVVRQGSRTSMEKLGAEECMMGIDHCRAGKWLVKSWRLPDEFAEATAADAEMTPAGVGKAATLMAIACRWADALGFCAGHMERIGIRDAIRAAPAHIAPKLKAASAEIGQKCRAKLLEYARGFDADTAKLFGKL